MSENCCRGDKKRKTAQHAHNPAFSQLSMLIAQHAHSSQLRMLTAQHAHSSACSQPSMLTAQDAHSSACSQSRLLRLLISWILPSCRILEARSSVCVLKLLACPGTSGLPQTSPCSFINRYAQGLRRLSFSHSGFRVCLSGMSWP